MAPKSRLSEAAAVKPPTTLSSSILIADTAQLTGAHPIRIGHNTVLHPRCRLNSALGPITIGDHCILNERTVLAAPDERGMVLDNYVVVEMNAVVEAARIGEGSVVEIGVRVGKGAVVGKVRVPPSPPPGWLLMRAPRTASLRRSRACRTPRWLRTTP